MDSYRLPLRYGIAVLCGTLFIFVMQRYLDTVFDPVAATALFSCIIAVTGEDVSLGPVILKTVYRSIGVVIGGISGYLLLYIPMVLFPEDKEVCLFLVPLFFIVSVQWITTGGWRALTAHIEKNKGNHCVIQLQVGFGLVYVGSWDSPDGGFNVAFGRMGGILAGGVAVLVGAYFAFPDTSIHVSSSKLSASMKTAGKLLVALCKDRVSGVNMAPYDYRGKVFASLKTPDDHMTLIDTMDKNIARVVSLQPFLYSEPSWVIGLPRELLGTGFSLAKHWGPFYAVLALRLSRLRSTLTAMDSNTRLDSDRPDKYIKANIAEKMNILSDKVAKSLDLVASFIESPFITKRGWKGSLELKQAFLTDLSALKKDIEVFSFRVVDEVRVSNSVRDRTWAEDDDNPLPTTLSNATEDTVQETSNLGVVKSSSPSKHKTYKETTLRHVRWKMGSTLDYYHTLYPLRTFCNLVVQCSIQVCSIIHESIDFIESLSEEDGKSLDRNYAYQSLHESRGPRSDGEIDLKVVAGVAAHESNATLSPLHHLMSSEGNNKFHDVDIPKESHKNTDQNI